MVLGQVVRGTGGPRTACLGGGGGGGGNLRPHPMTGGPKFLGPKFLGPKFGP